MIPACFLSSSIAYLTTKTISAISVVFSLIKPTLAAESKSLIRSFSSIKSPNRKTDLTLIGVTVCGGKPKTVSNCFLNSFFLSSTLYFLSKNSNHVCFHDCNMTSVYLSLSLTAKKRKN